MKKQNLPFLGIMLLLFACNNRLGSKETSNKMTFGDFVEIDKIEKVIMSNNSGTFVLNHTQTNKIKGELSSMIYDPNTSVKVGAISIELLINGEAHHIYSATHGDYIEVHRDIATKNESSLGKSEWIYFKIDGVNFDNYFVE